jgi:hypothetical protein
VSPTGHRLTPREIDREERESEGMNEWLAIGQGEIEKRKGKKERKRKKRKTKKKKRNELSVF